MNKFKLLFLVLVMALVGCSKQKMTTSKIKISGAGIFSGNLAIKADNGLLIYGKSSDGKSFSKRIDVNTVDLEFPNGTWNFYAVGWQQSGAVSALQGVTSCGKTEGIVLNGTDAVVNLSIANANCADPAFVGSMPSQFNSNQMLITPEFTSCKDVSNASVPADCNRTVNRNRGYATYYKIFVPQFKDFGKGPEEVSDAFVSSCIKITNGDVATSEAIGSQIAATMPSMLSFPMPINGFKAGVRVYYTSTDAKGCDDSNGYDQFLMGGPKAKLIYTVGNGSTKTVGNIYVSTTEADVCKAPRLDTTNNFAGGFGTYYSPYYICTPEQFNQISAQLGAASMATDHASIEILSDLNFGSTLMTPIGGDTTANSAGTLFAGTSATLPNRILFEGNNHRISNMFLTCSNTSTNVGLIRNSNFIDIANLIIDKAAVVCNNSSSNTNVSFLLGQGNDVNIKNVKVSGHIEGYQYTGGAIGLVNNKFNIDSFHSFLDLKVGYNSGGGLIGSAQSIANSSIVNSSSRGVIRANSSGNLGGIIGTMSIASASTFSLDKTLANVYLDGYTYLGGLFGNISYISSTGTVNLSNFYIKGAMNTMASNNTNVFVGGVVGNVSGISGTISVTAGFSSLVYSAPLLGSAATNGGGFFGELGTNTVNCTDYKFFANATVLGNTTSCNTGSNSFNTYTAMSTGLNTMAASYSSNWQQKPSGLPRLQMEYDTVRSGVKYLKANDCEGGYATLNGSGTAVNPYIVCTSTQLLAMTPGNVYKLGDDIIFDTTVSSPLAAGNYFLNGAGFSLYNFTIQYPGTPSANFGLFSDLQSLSKIGNFKMVFAKGFASSISTDVNAYSYGILAGKNSGIIEGVELVKSGIKITNLAGSTGSSLIGGLVGTNNGTISKADLNFDMKAGSWAGGGTFSSLGTISWGPIAAKNTGTISRVNLTGSTQIDPNNSSFAGYDELGELVAINQGNISEVKHQRSIMFYGASSNTLRSTFSHLAKLNTGSIKDIFFSPSSITLTNATGTGVVDTNISGTIARVVVNYPSTTAIISFPALGTVTDSFCYKPGGMTNCYTSITPSFTSPNYTVSGSLYGGSLAGSLPSGSTAWNMTTYPYPMPDSTYVWSHTAGSLPSLVRVEGGLSYYDNVFN